MDSNDLPAGITIIIGAVITGIIIFAGLIVTAFIIGSFIK